MSNVGNVSEKLQKKLKTLPREPGVYFHKDAAGEIIYVGKAAMLKNRVRQYFQSREDMDAKTRALVEEIADTDWVETETELDALFLESEMVKRYMPKFNILLRDDKAASYVRINMRDEVPDVAIVKNPLDDGAEYFGPYYSSGPVKKALRMLRRVFPYYDKPFDARKRADLNAHIGLSPGIEAEKMTAAEYKASLRKLIRYIRGERVEILRELNREMKLASLRQDFEEAARLRNQIWNMRALQTQIIFGDKEFLDISKDMALVELRDLLKLPELPRRIEGFDISHQSGTNVVSSMVVFKNGVSDRAEYRKFKIRREANDDFANMRETIERRLGHLEEWGRPDLVIVDGGAGQMSAVADLLVSADIPFLGRSKSGDHGRNAEFEIIIPEDSGGFKSAEIVKDSHAGKLLTRIDEESHRFAVSYHTILKRKLQTASALDDVPGIGPKTKAVLKRKIGSVARIRETPIAELEAIIGRDKAKRVKKYL